MEKLTHSNRASWLNTVWEALHMHRETNMPEGDSANDETWNNICTAMAWIAEELNVDQSELD
jgi:hypothetical protein